MTTADDVHTVSRDWETYSSERGGVTRRERRLPDRARAGDVHRDGPAQARPSQGAVPAGFTPKRIADHEDAIRAITVGVLDRLEGRETCDLVNDVAQPVVSRVIGSFMGIPEPRTTRSGRG